MHAPPGKATFDHYGGHRLLSAYAFFSLSTICRKRLSMAMMARYNARRFHIRSLYHLGSVLVSAWGSCLSFHTLRRAPTPAEGSLNTKQIACCFMSSPGKTNGIYLKDDYPICHLTMCSAYTNHTHILRSNPVSELQYRTKSRPYLPLVLSYRNEVGRLR